MELSTHLGPHQCHPEAEVASGLMHLGDTEAGASFFISFHQHTHKPVCLLFPFPLCAFAQGVTGHIKWETALERENKQRKGERSAVAPTKNHTYPVFPTSGKECPLLEPGDNGLGVPKSRAGHGNAPTLLGLDVLRRCFCKGGRSCKETTKD